MDHTADGSLRYSPRDLVAYLEGDFAAWCERMFAERGRARGAPDSAELHWATPDEDPESALAAQKGREHEERYLRRMRDRYPGMVEIVHNDPAARDLTLAAMQSAAPMIYQGHLVVDGWQGYPDFLVRCGGAPCPCGGHHYNPWDTKLARSAKPYFLIQLCAYAEMLEALGGFRPDRLVFVMGNDKELPFEARHFFYYYRQLKRSFMAFQANWQLEARPDPGLDRSWGRWTETAEKILAQSDHLSRVAGITRGQVRRLEEGGVTSLAMLAASEPDRHVRRVSSQVFSRLQRQACLQLASRNCPRPRWELREPSPEEPRRGLALLPPRSDGDVFFDMEGFPYAEDGLEYLWGAVTVDDVAPRFHDWWAHDKAEERAALEGFIDWVMARRRHDPSLHIYHYASYEVSAVSRLSLKYGTREAEVDDLLRSGVFVDLYKVVKQGFIVGTPSYSLKEIERLYMGPRSEDVKSASASVIEYQRWLDSGEPGNWEESPILRGIREYNRVDCDSTWGLRSWLLDRQREKGIAFVPNPFCHPDPERSEGEGGMAPSVAEPALSAAEGLPQDDKSTLLAARLVERADGATDPKGEPARLDQLVGWLVEFHRREEKPMWWRKYDRHEMTVEERYEDRDCLADLTRTERPAWAIKRSTGFEYRYDLAQETKLGPGDPCWVAGTELGCDIVAMDEDAGLVELKVGPGKSLPDSLCLIPNEFVSAEPIKKAIVRFAEAWERGQAPQAVEDLLRRRPPRLIKSTGVILSPSLPLRVDSAKEPYPDACDLAARLDGTTLCIQGPPGTGKTYTAAAIIVELLRRGRRIGVTAQSHKVILHLMDAIIDGMEREGVAAPLYKVLGGDEEPLPEGSQIRGIASAATSGVVGDGPVLVGGTAWAFSREELEGRFDYVFIDEAGQVSLANAVAIGLATKNLVLIGDQMQLSQPSKGSHPGESGLSCLEYFLHGHATVPAELGIFLGSSRRMHPDVCRFISDAVYEGRLGSVPDTRRHRVIRGKDTVLVPVETGIAWVPVEHDGCAQDSPEECEQIVAIVDELLRRDVVDREGKERRMTLNDILIVAPFNLQVRCLRQRLPGARIGSVDKFQGQEAPVVIVSLCASTLDEAPRGAGFLLSPNRLNVAVSRAEALAIVVGSPELMNVRCRTVEEMKLVNLLCHLVQYAEGAA